MEHAGRSMRADGFGRAATFACRHARAFACRVIVHRLGRWRAGRRCVKIGVLNDMSGLYSEIGGAGSVVAARLAVEDFNPAAHGMKVEIVSGDHQNKPDVGANSPGNGTTSIMSTPIVDIPHRAWRWRSANWRARRTRCLLGLRSPPSSDLTGPKCSPNTVHWTYDTWMLAHGTGKAMVQTGGDTWFFITADYAFGQALERDTSDGRDRQRRQGGRQRAPSAQHCHDFSSFLLQAQASKAKIIGLANAGGDTDQRHQAGRRIRHRHPRSAFRRPLGLHQRRRCVGAETAQGLVLTETWYWDMT